MEAEQMLNQETLRSGTITRASKVVLNIGFKGDLGTAHKKYEEIVSKLGGDPDNSQPMGSFKVGRQFVLSDGNKIKVRAASKKLTYLNADSAPTVEIEITVRKKFIKMRFRN